MGKRQLHVVIIEDDPSTLAWLRMLTTREGLRVTAMETVIDLSALTALQADVFVIDEELPGMTGHLICMFLRTKASTGHLPVMLISAYPELFHFADSCGADERLAKPFTAEQFLAALNLLLTQSQYNFLRFASQMAIVECAPTSAPGKVQRGYLTLNHSDFH